MLGLAGGMTLLGVMLLFYDPLVAIPLHGAIQLVSNGSRAWIQREHVERGIVRLVLAAARCRWASSGSRSRSSCRPRSRAR